MPRARFIDGDSPGRRRRQVITPARFFSTISLAALASMMTPGRVQTSAPVILVHLPPGGIQPQIAVDATGVAHVLYFKGEAAHGDLYYTRLRNDGTLSTAIQVNAHSGSAMATGTMRGGHLAIGKDGRVHVAWTGSAAALPRAAGNQTPVLYTRLNAAGTGFEPERNVVQRHVIGLDGGTVAAGPDGSVYVAWHAFEPGRSRIGNILCLPRMIAARSCWRGPKARAGTRVAVSLGNGLTETAGRSANLAARLVYRPGVSLRWPPGRTADS